MNIKLNLSQHCIETEIKLLYNQSVLKYFKANDKNQLEKQMKILQHALKTLDFKKLRSHLYNRVEVLAYCVYWISLDALFK